MSDLPRSMALLARVGRRLGLAAWGRRVYLTFLFVCSVYAAVLLVSRFSGMIPDWFAPTTLVAIPVVALLLAAVMYRRPTTVDAARVVDRYHGTKDLFLNLTMLDRAIGAYKPLVAGAAESRASGIEPAEVVPYRWGARATRAGLALAVLLIAVMFLPQLDPFGKVDAAVQVEKQREELSKSAKATEMRAAELVRDDNEGEESEDVKQAIENLTNSFRKMKAQQKRTNFKILGANQKIIGEKWRNISAEKLRDLLSQMPASQRFGGAKNSKLEKWMRELQSGSSRSLQKELSEMQGDLQKLMAEKDPVKRAELQRSLKKRLQDLEEFATDSVNSKPLQAALKRAMKQLESSKFDGLSTESLESLEKTLDLAKLELQEIKQSAKDLKALEESLKVIQMAKKANEKGELDGEACEGCQSLEDYAELFAELGGMEGEEGGTGGLGEGGAGVEEDDSVDTGFKSEQSKSAVTAGKVLLSFQSKGLSDSGEADQNYRQLVDKVKDGVSEAILQEQIPPGYHESIKSYFDTISDGPLPKAAAQPEAEAK